MANSLTRWVRDLFGGKDSSAEADAGATRPAPAVRMAPDSDSTQPLPELNDGPAPDTQPRPIWPPSNRRMLGVAQDVGRVRNHNEDTLMVFSGELGGLEPMPQFGLYVIADGMGGHSLGERASGVAARTITREVLAVLSPSLLARPDQDDIERPLLTDVMENALLRSNQAVHQHVPDGGTTLTAALVIGESIVIGHVGDSRAYFIHAGGCEQLTRDHSLVQRLKELGQITDEEAAVHPQRSVLYRAVGQGDGLEVDIISRRIEPGARLLLCSDGMWGLVPDHAILQIARNAAGPQEAATAMVEAANQAGGPDNISVVIVQFPG
ncbi:MAG: serine/threonine-protein phosphatase [Anaerolineales bacterium]|nr:serine/threonine-protein phosphatase [Anaerolineales bacterium]